ncbi:MAG: hypothetical protein J7J17_02505 [Hadesarchaea archaeon]|nr:hypothetical protein [Hadesarchaea archaeon]
MERGVKTFAEALWGKKIKAARKKAERIVKRLNAGGEYQRGYAQALRGMVAALESDDDLALLRRIIDGENPERLIRRHLEEFKVRASQDFRPEDERGYYAAWVDVLQIFSGKVGKSKESQTDAAGGAELTGGK